jgi:NADH-quinone oxidoreductase subunit N
MLNLVLTSVAGLFYHLRIVVTLYPAPPELAAPMQVVPCGDALILVALTPLLIWFGVYPTPLLNLIRTTVAGFNCPASLMRMQP